jgi:hypothetical protein
LAEGAYDASGIVSLSFFSEDKIKANGKVKLSKIMVGDSNNQTPIFERDLIENQISFSDFKERNPEIVTEDGIKVYFKESEGSKTKEMILYYRFDRTYQIKSEDLVLLETEIGISQNKV